MGLAWLVAVVAAALRGIWLLYGYLNGASAFPQPLPPEEENAALAALHRGDAAARDRLIEHNLRLVAHIVKKFDGCGEDPEDLIQIGTVGLIKGIETFNPGRGTRLATYAARCIENELLLPLPCLPGRPAASPWCTLRPPLTGHARRARWRRIGRPAGQAPAPGAAAGVVSAATRFAGHTGTTAVRAAPARRAPSPLQPTRRWVATLPRVEPGRRAGREPPRASRGEKRWRPRPAPTPAAPRASGHEG